MKMPTAYQDALDLAMWAHGQGVSLADLREAAERVATFASTAMLTERQDHEVSSLLSGLIGLQGQHVDAAPVGTAQRARVRDRLRSMSTVIRF